MRAVNLVPVDLRRGGPGFGSGSSGVTYVVLAALVGLVAMAGVYALVSHQISDRKQQISQATREAQVAEARAAALAPYIQVQATRQQEVALVTSIVQRRFNWGLAMRQVAQALPSSSWLTSLVGTDSPSVGLQGSGASSLRGSLHVPAFEMTGCSLSQPAVADALAHLRQIPGVTVVSLSLSDKGSSSAAGAGSGSAASSSSGATGNGAGACGANHPQFQLVIFYTGTGAGSPYPAALAQSITAAAAPTSPMPAAAATPAAGSTR